MNEDYLWDKTGNDPEIEMLENALQAFRYKETAAPALPVEVLPFKKEAPPRKKFQFAFAIAACLAFGILALGVWFQVLRNDMPIDKQLAEVKPQENAILPEIKTVDDFQPVSNEATSPVKKLEISKLSSEKKIIKIRKTLPPVTPRREVKAPNSKSTKPPAVRLTEEEQYAYNQLMTALSITSSKLKLVKEKVEGMDD
jgi:hypothetical protein